MTASAVVAEKSALTLPMLTVAMRVVAPASEVCTSAITRSPLTTSPGSLVKMPLLIW